MDSVDGLSLSARYRYDMRQNTSTTEYQIDDNGDIVGVEKNIENQRRHRLTANVNYSSEKLALWSRR